MPQGRLEHLHLLQTQHFLYYLLGEGGNVLFQTLLIITLLEFSSCNIFGLPSILPVQQRLLYVGFDAFLKNGEHLHLFSNVVSNFGQLWTAGELLPVLDAVQ